MFIVTNDKNIVEGFRHLTEEEIVEQFLEIDLDRNYFITKNEWMISFIKLLEKDLPSLEKEGPDAIMTKIQELSDEFDKIDLDHNKQIDYLEYKEFIQKCILISE